MAIYLLAGGVALAVAAILSPAVAWWASRRGFLEEPNARRVHRSRMPTGGGLAIALGFWAAAAATGRPLAGWPGILLGSLVVLAVGLWDDRWGLKPWQKFLGQLAAASILVAGGTRIEFLTHPFGGMVYVGWLGIPLTLLWIVALMNAMNFIDGLDGLAAGICAIACVPLLVITLQRGQADVALLTFCLLGAALGFLFFNFHPARLFMGDAGAMFIGFVLGAISVEGALKGAATMALNIPLVALGLPIFDTACAIIRRGRNGRPIYGADAGHVHHRLLQTGFSHRRAVLFLYFVSALFACAALVLYRAAPMVRLPLMVPLVLALVAWAYRLRIFDDRPVAGDGHGEREYMSMEA